jgi:hypothetical protein
VINKVMNFKDFVKYCELALGDISPSMFDVLGQNTPEVGGPILLPSTVSGTEAQDVVLPHLPGLDLKVADTPTGGIVGNLLGLPETPGSGEITHLDKSKNPITIIVTDDKKKVHQLAMNLDQFNRIKGSKPEKGRHLTFILQRRPSDTGRWMSQVAPGSCYCT